ETPSSGGCTGAQLPAGIGPPDGRASRMSPSVLPTFLGDVTSLILHSYGLRPFHTDGDLLALGFAPDGTLWSVEEPGVLRNWDLFAQKQIDWHPLEELATTWCFNNT